MKKIQSIMMLAAMVYLAGCASFQTTAGKLLQSTALTADGAMRGWSTWVSTGKATPADEARVKDAYAKYQVAMQAAQSAYVAAVATGNTSAWQQAEAVLAASSGSLIQLVQMFTQPSTLPKP